MRGSTADETPSERSGLRERKRRAVRSELSLAALRLAKQHGLENVRTEDIVAAVGVSRRTFSNYFTNKYEAIAHRLLERAEQAAEGLRARPHGEPLWKALTAALIAPYAGLALSDSGESREATLLVLEHPALRAELWKGNFGAQQALTLAVAERTRLDDETHLYPALVAATATAVVTTVLERWLRLKRPPALIPMLSQALEQVAQGLPEPARPRPARRKKRSTP